MKKVVEEIEKATVLVNNVNIRKIYATQGIAIYKLHRIGDNWGFCSMSNSINNGYGHQSSTIEAVSRAMKLHTVYEFDTEREFLEWALAQC